MEYLLSDLARDVRVALDHNNSSASLSGLRDVDTLTLDEIILSKIELAARLIEIAAPSYMVGPGEPFGDSIGWDSEPGYGSGFVMLPRDFLRLVSFKMSDWSMAATVAITEDDPLYAHQRSRYPGVRGCPQRPIVAVVQRPVGLVLEFYSCTGGPDVYITRGRYLPVPKAVNGSIDLPELLKDAIVYETASLTAMTVEDNDVAAAMHKTAADIINLAETEA